MQAPTVAPRPGIQPGAPTWSAMPLLPKASPSGRGPPIAGTGGPRQGAGARGGLWHSLLGPQASQLRTRTVRGTRGPVWEETLTYHGFTLQDARRKTLR